MKYSERGDLATAAHYLQLPRSEDVPRLAMEFHALRHTFNGNPDLLSDDPNGTVEAGLPLGQVRAGEFVVGGKTTDLILVRVDDPEYGKIWLVSQETVSKIPGLYAEMQREGRTPAERMVPAALSSHYLLGIPLAKWLGWLLSIPLAWFLTWLLALLLSAPRRI
ncbi:MAG TPA: hypothetical protein VMT53_10445, partial [Terriglobales bacterium]|nr:hypothetical protein [Terriglobales bacterium]